MSERVLQENQCLLIDRSSRGRLIMSGRDRVDLLQRLSTNDLRNRAPGQGVETVLTNHIGRIIDLLLVLFLPESLIVVTGPERSEEIAAYLRRNIFFMDQVRVDDYSAEWGQIELYGAEAGAALERVAAVRPADLPLFGHTFMTIDGSEIRLARIRPLAGGGWTAIGPRDSLQQLQTRLLAAGAVAIDSAELDVLRVEAGQPGLPELNLEYIPLETGLWDAVSFSKGCYVGQEIIARMESRGKLAKRLMGLRLAELPATLPARLEADGKDAGDLTSAVLSPRFGPIGLGYVRTAYAEPGTALSVEGRPATVTTLPFE
ncbi:MAG: glycine cleavage system protein T [Herpetosiphonaceae bacterium]|nr:MAG: glycine cleavage system protein T [Herpetosiphonaceae bacterium]